MWAMIVKEFRQLKRDRRTLAMLVALPVLLLVVFGYAARFEVSRKWFTNSALSAEFLKPCALKNRWMSARRIDGEWAGVKVSFAGSCRVPNSSYMSRLVIGSTIRGVRLSR